MNRLRRESGTVIFKKNPAPPPLVNQTSGEPPVYDWAESFRAKVMELVLKYRGDHGKNLVAEYVSAVESELGRYQAKNLDSATSDAIRDIADRAIARVRRGGVTAFEGE